MDYPRWTPAYFERIRPTFLESWPPGLAALAMAQRGLPLGEGEVRALLCTPPLWRDRLVETDPSALHALAARLKPLIEVCFGGAFVRLGSRSPKDSPIFQANRGCVRRPVLAIKLLQTSQRTRADLMRSLERGYLPHLFVRPWLALDPWQEFQCFLKGRKLVGIAQLDTVNYGAHPELRAAAPGIEPAVREFAARFAAESHLDNAVFEVAVARSSRDATALDVRLMDINPWGPPTVASLFQWGLPGDFDGSFRYLR